MKKMEIFFRKTGIKKNRILSYVFFNVFISPFTSLNIDTINRDLF